MKTKKKPVVLEGGATKKSFLIPISMENQHHDEQNETRIQGQNPESQAPQSPEKSIFNSMRGLTGALAAAAILGTATQAHAEDKKNETHTTAPKIARLGGKPSDDAGVMKIDATKPAHDDDNHMKHHTLKLGAIGSISKHPAFGTEFSWSYMPNLDASKPFHFTVTPIDFFAAQHHLEYEGKTEGTGGIVTAPKYFLGSMAGVTYMFNKHLELEVEVGGGAMAVPYFGKMTNNEPKDLKYQLAPVVKADIQMDFVLNPHFRTYVAYSPEFVPTPIPHAMKGDEVEKKIHLSHIVAIGVGTEF
jgi:hypothetical protein